MSGVTETFDLDSLPDGKLRTAALSGLPVLLARRGGEVFALENRCAHMGCPLSGGRLDGYTLTCPCHDWRFDVRDGRFLDAPEIALRVYPVEVREGKISVRLS